MFCFLETAWAFYDVLIVKKEMSAKAAVEFVMTGKDAVLLMKCCRRVNCGVSNKCEK